MSRTITKANAEETRDAGELSGEPRKSEALLSGTRRVIWFGAPLIVLVVTALIYGSIYFREESLATGIGANLVPAERILKGEVPYRDFYKIQTPGILLLNAGLFKLFGTSLLTAFRGVLFFKVLAIVMSFVVARRVVSQTAALVPTALSVLWLPPGGPFRPAPIQYEMLFILGAVFFTLRWIDSRKAFDAFAAGLAVGIVAVFKQNVGVYLAIALAISLIVNTRGVPRSFADVRELYFDSRKNLFMSYAAAGLGVALVLLALLAYLVSNHALGAAMRIFITGPGEHIQMKLTGYPLPKQALLVFVVGLAALKIARVVARRFPRLRMATTAVAVTGAAVCAAFAPQSFIDNSIFWFPPALFLYCAWICVSASRQRPNEQAREQAVLLVLLVFSVAAYLEVFPRSVRGLVIGTLPLAFILLAFVFEKHDSNARAAKDHIYKLSSRSQLAIVAIIALIFAVRLITPRYLSFEAGHLSFKADTELSFDRGRGIYLPAVRAGEVNDTVEFVRARVDEGGFFFAHALDSTPYYFLADRNSPTGATLWNDAGTNDAERVRTMQMLRQKQVKLVLTSDQAIASERYEPLVEYLTSEFHQTKRIGKTVVLERD